MVRICFDKELNGRAGGPSGYLYNLREGIIKSKKEGIYFSDVQSLNNKTVAKSRRKDFMKKIIMNIPFLYEKYLINRYNSYINKPFDLNTSDTLCHVHTPLDFARLKRMGGNIEIVFTPHSPEASYLEPMSKLKVSKNKNKFKKLEKMLKNIDIDVFKSADYIIFPSKEAMEPYFETLPEFGEIIENKKVYFMMSGTKGLECKKDRKEFRESVNIPEEAFVISYVGRHNWVKGFGNLVEFSKDLLESNKNIYILTAGTGEIKPLNHERWIDIGWTNDPASLINASDVFILPNKRTYFDLILLEVLSLGKPVIASKTGGNITVSNISNGVKLYEKDNKEEFIKIIEDIYENRKLLDYMGKENLKVYNNYFTIEEFTNRYISIIETIKSDIK